ncbi:hypothetical protein D1007_42125 [Hordeum vulgare]|nr:hypothetical protein D1007_42125 [Hordeum vulgare]
MAPQAAETEAARNRPPRVPQLITQAEQMAFLVSLVQGMENNIEDIMQNQKSLERVVETKFHNMDVKVTQLTTIIRKLQHEVDSVEIPRSQDEYEDEDNDDEEESPLPLPLGPRRPIKEDVRSEDAWNTILNVTERMG